MRAPQSEMEEKQRKRNGQSSGPEWRPFGGGFLASSEGFVDGLLCPCTGGSRKSGRQSMTLKEEIRLQGMFQEKEVHG